MLAFLADTVFGWIMMIMLKSRVCHDVRLCIYLQHLSHAAVMQGVFGPSGGKHLIAFIDDLNMPQKSKFGFIPPLELLKLWVDYGFWYVSALTPFAQVCNVCRALAALHCPADWVVDVISVKLVQGAAALPKHAAVCFSAAWEIDDISQWRKAYMM